MQTNNSSLEFSIVKTIKDIPREDWENLFCKEITEGYDYQKTLEESNLKEFAFGYLLGKKDKDLVAIIPFFVMDFSLPSLTQGPLHWILSGLKGLLRLKIIFLGAPTTEEFYFGIAKTENLDTLMENAIKFLLAYVKQNRINGIAFYNLSQKNAALADYLKKRKFIELEGLPNTLAEINSNSWDGYLNSLSHNMRKDVKRKLRKSESLVKLNTFVREDIEDISSEIYKLYSNNFDDSGVHFEVLTEEFFKNIGKNMPGIAKYFITYDKDKIVAFNLCLVKGDLCIDKFIGFDSAVSHQYHLYFTSFRHNIEWCIKNGIRYYQPGATDYHPKVRLGAKLIPLHVYAKAMNPVLNLFIRLFSKFIEPKNIDTSWKGLKG